MATELEQDQVQRFADMQQQARAHKKRVPQQQNVSSGIAASLAGNVWKKWKWEMMLAAAPVVFQILLWGGIVLVILILFALIYQCSLSVSDAWACFQNLGFGALRALFDAVSASL